MRNNANGVSEVNGAFGANGERNAIGVATYHVADLSITGSDSSIEFAPGEMKVNPMWKFLRGAEIFIWD